MKLNLLFSQQKQKFIDESNNREDREVVKFLNTLAKDKPWKYLEVGSGLGRFSLKVKNLFQNINIECFEINPDLAKITSDKGLKTTVGNAIDMSYPDESFDVVHCSHVIEHFKYPEVTELLDQLMRVTKTSGYIIIRSPLWYPGFYLDIDHIRPYPPETILSYFKNKQQQKIGTGNLEIINCWYRRENYKIFNIGSSKIKYFFNALLAFSWTYIKFPFSKKNGYVLILRKIN
jgi:ubiquinone/menaquinone biosynthesis C-methylase UbiE